MDVKNKDNKIPVQINAEKVYVPDVLPRDVYLPGRRSAARQAAHSRFTGLLAATLLVVVLIALLFIWYWAADSNGETQVLELQVESFTFSEGNFTTGVKGAVICGAHGIVKQIPAEYEGVPVVAVRRDAFKGATVMCQLPETVWLIESFAFRNAGLPESFDLTNVSVIGEGAFANSRLSTTFHLGRSPVYIGPGAFWHDSVTEGSGYARLFTYPDSEQDFYARINENILASENSLGAVRRVTYHCTQNPLYFAG